MLEIYPVQTKKEQEIICRMCDQEYDPDAMCYAAYTDGVLAGACQFTIHEKSGYILSIKESGEVNDSDALFIMGRATLNFIDLCGVHSAYFKGEVKDEQLIKRIGFRKNEDGNWFMDLTGFFEAPCQHGHGG